MLCVVFLIRVKFISFSLILLRSCFILVILIINISLQRFLFLTRRRRILVNMKFMRAKGAQLVRLRVNRTALILNREAERIAILITSTANPMRVFIMQM